MTPYYQDDWVTLYQGHVLEVLRALPAASVQCCLTSPPFWALRDYGLEPVVWGGDAGCQHVWGEIGAGRRRDSQRLDELGARLGTGGGHKISNSNHSPASTGAFCQRCAAWNGCLGLEPTPALYVAHLVEVFAEVWRVLRDDGTVWCELGDSFQDKQLQGIPWRVAFALQAWGWTLRSETIWHHVNAMPESVTDRPTKAHSTIFLLTKQGRYFYDADAIRENNTPEMQRRALAGHTRGNGHRDASRNDHATLQAEICTATGRNVRSVWPIPTQGYPGAHFATWPEAIARRCLLAGTSERGCCAVCGAPWVRETEKSPYSLCPLSSPLGVRGIHISDYRAPGQPQHGQRAVDIITTGWRPSCACNAPVTPCVILDPFTGSGTSLAVARQQLRRAIGIEAKDDYCDLALARLNQLALPLGIPAKEAP